MKRKMEGVLLQFNFYDCCSNYGDRNLEKGRTLVLLQQLGAWCQGYFYQLSDLQLVTEKIH